MYAFLGEKYIKILLDIGKCIYLFCLCFYKCSKTYFSFLWESMARVQKRRGLQSKNLSLSRYVVLIHSVFILIHGYALSELFMCAQLLLAILCHR